MCPLPLQGLVVMPRASIAVRRRELHVLDVAVHL